MDYASLTDTELRELWDKAHRGAMRLFDLIHEPQTKMRNMATWTPEYQEMDAETSVLMAAASEQRQLAKEIGDAYFERNRYARA